MPINKIAPYDTSIPVFAAPVLIPKFAIFGETFTHLALHAVTAHIHRELGLPPYKKGRFFAFYSKGETNVFMGPFVEKPVPVEMVVGINAMLGGHAPAVEKKISVSYDPALKHPSHVLFADGLTGMCYYMEYVQARLFFSNREWIRYAPMDLTKPMNYTHADAELFRNLP